MTFPCTKCGACCKMLDHVGALTPTFPREFILPDGHTCRNLTAENTCAIYETRPMQCRIDDTFAASGLVKILTQDEWHRYVALSSCALSVSIHGGEVPMGLGVSAKAQAIWRHIADWNYGLPKPVYRAEDWMPGFAEPTGWRFRLSRWLIGAGLRVGR